MLVSLKRRNTSGKSYIHCAMIETNRIKKHSLLRIFLITLAELFEPCFFLRYLYHFLQTGYILFFSLFTFSSFKTIRVKKSTSWRGLERKQQPISTSPVWSTFSSNPTNSRNYPRKMFLMIVDTFRWKVDNSFAQFDCLTIAKLPFHMLLSFRSYLEKLC